MFDVKLLWIFYGFLHCTPILSCETCCELSRNLNRKHFVCHEIFHELYTKWNRSQKTMMTAIKREAWFRILIGLSNVIFMLCLLQVSCFFYGFEEIFATFSSADTIIKADTRVKWSTGNVSNFIDGIISFWCFASSHAVWFYNFKVVTTFH